MKKCIIYFPLERLEESVKPNFFVKVKSFQINADSEIKIPQIIEELNPLG